jgi:hypothetical protein
MPSRRQFVVALGTGVISGVAGCGGSGSGGSATIDCHTHALAHGDGDVLDGGAMATVEDGDVRLAVPLSVDTVRETGLDSLELYDAAGDLAHVIPVSTGDRERMATKAGVNDGQLQYEQYLGERPFHGQIRVVAVDGTGDRLDSITVEFNCFPEAETDQ